MKKIVFYLAVMACLAACKTVKVQGEVTSFSSGSNGVSIGVHAHGQGQYKPMIDSLAKGYPVWIAGQQIQILHTDTSVDIYGTLNLRYR